MPKKTIRLSKSCLSNNEKQAVLNVLDREFLGMGTEVKKFEDELTKFFDRPVVCVSTGTAALHLALQAVGIGRGDEVLVQSLTYIASFQAISATGATPIACEVNKDTLCLDWKDAEQKITPKTKAIMPVHYSGGVGMLDEIYAFADKYNLRVVEDAAHAFGTKYKGKQVGSFGDIACFSFDGIKNITSGEGGCIVTNDTSILKKAKEARLLGVESDTEKRFSGERSWDFDVIAQGWRYHMSDIMASIGIEQLKRFSEFSCNRQRLANLYDSFFVDNSQITPISHNYVEVVPHIYVVRIKKMKNRKLLQEKLLEIGISTGYHYQPNHLLTYYKNNIHHLPITEKIYSELLTLPMHPDISENDIQFISTNLINFLKYA